MSTQSFRAAVVADIKAWMQANHPTVPVSWENGPPMDKDAAGTVFLDVEIRWHDAENVTVGTRPRGRDTGVIATNVYVKQGEGTLAADQLVDGLRELLRNRRLGGGALEYPRRSTSPPMLGWHRAGLLTPFTLDSA
jgi:hypothetical protein